MNINRLVRDLQKAIDTSNDTFNEFIAGVKDLATPEQFATFERARKVGGWLPRLNDAFDHDGNLVLHHDKLTMVIAQDGTWVRK